MILVLSTLQIQRLEYFRYIKFVTIVDILSYYAINLDVVSLLADSPFFILTTLNLVLIDIIDRFK